MSQASPPAMTQYIADSAVARTNVALGDSLRRAAPPRRMPERGFEPPPSYLDKNLNLARLPIPPLGQVGRTEREAPAPRDATSLCAAGK